MNDKESRMISVELTNVTKSYYQGKVEVRAIRGISLAIETGAFAAFAGPSGSGKTTLLNIIGSLDSADSGSVVVDQQDFSQMTSKALADFRLHRIGFVFQSYNLIPVLSALENVEYVMLLQGVPVVERKLRAETILEEVGLKDLLSRRPAELSGGQQQRVAVARALVSNPSIVLADEPTANLDSKTGEGLLDLMKTMNQEKEITFIFSTHDPRVMDYAQRIITIRDGRVDADKKKQPG